MLLLVLQFSPKNVEVGVVGFKKDLYKKALEKLGDFELKRFYVIATFLDQRYVCYRVHI